MFQTYIKSWYLWCFYIYIIIKKSLKHVDSDSGSISACLGFEQSASWHIVASTRIISCLAFCFITPFSSGCFTSSSILQSFLTHICISTFEIFREKSTLKERPPETHADSNHSFVTISRSAPLFLPYSFHHWQGRRVRSLHHMQASFCKLSFRWTALHVLNALRNSNFHPVMVSQKLMKRSQLIIVRTDWSESGWVQHGSSFRGEKWSGHRSADDGTSKWYSWNFFNRTLLRDYSSTAACAFTGVSVVLLFIISGNNFNVHLWNIADHTRWCFTMQFGFRVFPILQLHRIV